MLSLVASQACVATGLIVDLYNLSFDLFDRSLLSEVRLSPQTVPTRYHDCG
jgi:hypothetical protein